MFGEPGFTSSVANSVLRSACALVGLNSDGARLLRIGENAIYVLDSKNIIVRVARSSDRMARVEKELCMSRWLYREGIPAVRVYEDIKQPVVAEGFPVTFWRQIRERGPKPTHGDLAVLLSQLHSLGESPCPLPKFQPLILVRSRIAGATAISARDRDFLLTHHDELVERYKHLEFALPVGPIHGDAWIGNLLRGDENVYLLDLEASGIGPREWDLMSTSIAVSRYGLPEATYRSFCAAYGFDVTQWPGYPTLRAVRELTMTTWLMQNAAESKEIAEESQVRIDSIRDKDLDRVWRTF